MLRLSVPIVKFQTLSLHRLSLNQKWDFVMTRVTHQSLDYSMNLTKSSSSVKGII